MDYLFPPPAIPSVPVQGDERRFGVRRVFCIGRNYADHIREMEKKRNRATPPVFFMKPADALVTDGADVPWPQATQALHHEVEMVVALGKGGRAIPFNQADEHIFGHAVGLDLTRRDLQKEAKKRGMPWDTAKGLDHGAPISAICPAAKATPADDTQLSLQVNGELRQQTELSAMLSGVPEILAALSRLFELQTGDLIFTGTPAGVQALSPGDSFHAELAGIATLDGRMAQP